MTRLLLLFIGLLPLSLAAQNGIIGTGFANGWSNPGDALAFSAGAGNSRTLTVNPNGVGDQYFRFVRFWNNDNTEYGPFGCTDTEWTDNEGSTYFDMPACGGGAFYINCPNMTDNYVFKTAGPQENDFVYFRIQGAIRTVSTVTAPADMPANTAFEVTATTDDALNTGQYVFLRYTTDNFASSTVLAMSESTGFAAATDYVASIPGQAEGTNVNYYVFTSGTPTPTSGSDADWFTINLNNNGGANYSYNVVAAAPVSLVSFTGKAERENVRLQWITASETDNDYFDIEWSNNGQTWETIGQVAGQGTTFQTQEYQYQHLRPEANTNYYRLRQVDYSGAFSYSPIVVVRKSTPLTFQLYPNPATDVLFIQTQNGNRQASTTFELYNSNGQQVAAGPLTEEGPISIDALSAGLYFVNIRNSQGQILQQDRFVKR